MSECAKRNCSYYWQDEDEAYPRCHYDDPMFPAPCEEDDDDYDTYDYMNDIDLDDWGDY